MGVFVEPNDISFQGLSETPTTILTTASHPLYVTSLSVTNNGDQTIRFNLKQITTQISPVEILLFTNVEIPPKTSIDFIGNGTNKKSTIFLKYSTMPDPEISESLECFSNGYPQSFDCNISYYLLKDIP